MGDLNSDEEEYERPLVDPSSSMPSSAAVHHTPRSKRKPNWQAL